MRNFVNRASLRTLRGREEVVVVAEATSIKEEATGTREAVKVISRLTRLARSNHFAGLLARVHDFKILCVNGPVEKFNQFNKAGIFLFAITCFRDCNIGFLEKQIHDIVGFAICQFISNHFLDHLLNVALTSWSFWTISVFPIEDYNSKVLLTQIAKICEGFSHICFVQLCKLIFL